MGGFLSYFCYICPIIDDFCLICFAAVIQVTILTWQNH